MALEKMEHMWDPLGQPMIHGIRGKVWVRMERSKPGNRTFDGSPACGPNDDPATLIGHLVFRKLRTNSEEGYLGWKAIGNADPY